MVLIMVTGNYNFLNLLYLGLCLSLAEDSWLGPAPSSAPRPAPAEPNTGHLGGVQGAGQRLRYSRGGVAPDSNKLKVDIFYFLYYSCQRNFGKSITIFG